MKSHHHRQKLAYLWTLYFVQGLPYGFQIIALPAFLRQSDLSLKAIGFASLLALPWAIKVVWSPMVDRFSFRRLGRRRSWILPLQILLALTCLGGAFTPPDTHLRELLLVVLLANFFASVLDIAVDGLAIDLLRTQDLGWGNVAQVVGFKVGMLTGGGLLVSASETLAWSGLFFAMAALVLTGFLVSLFFSQEPLGSPRETESVSSILRGLYEAVRQPGSLLLLVFIATYKLGEAMADHMFKPFLVDAGLTVAEVGQAVGTWGMIFSIMGSFLGGYLATRLPLIRALGLTALLRALAVGSEWWLALVGVTMPRALGVIAAENLFGGALTTAMFAYMMSRVNRKIGASHYTLLATVEVMGKILIASRSGVVAESLGYSQTFALATLLSVLFLPLLWPIARFERLGDGLKPNN